MSLDIQAYTEFIPYFCRDNSGISGIPFKTPWYKNIRPEYRSGINPNDTKNKKIENWTRAQKKDPIYSKSIDNILRLNEYCSSGIVENKRNWGDYNSQKYSKCENLFKMYHKHINFNTYGFLIDINDDLIITKIDKQNIVKNLLLNDMKNTGKIYHIKSKGVLAPTVYIYNETNDKMICQSNVGPLGNAHEAITYRDLLVEYGQ